VSSCVATRYAIPTDYTIVRSLSPNWSLRNGVSYCRCAASYPPVATSSSTDAVFASLHPTAAEANGVKMTRPHALQPSASLAGERQSAANRVNGNWVTEWMIRHWLWTITRHTYRVALRRYTSNGQCMSLKASRAGRSLLQPLFYRGQATHFSDWSPTSDCENLGRALRVSLLGPPWLRYGPSQGGPSPSVGPII